MKFNILNSKLFCNWYVYYLTRGFIASTRAFNLPTRTFSLPTCVFNLTTRAFSALTRGFEVVTREFEIVTSKFELVARRFELVTQNSCFTFPAKKDFIALKTEFEKLDINKLVNVPTSLNNLETKVEIRCW